MKLNMITWFIIYLFLLFSLTIFSRSEEISFIWQEGIFDYYVNSSLNIIPFKSMLFMIKNLSIYSININIFGNIIVFMPFALFLPYFRKKKYTYASFILNVALISLMIETIQLITITGSFDIDDIILNTFGAFLFFNFLNLPDIKRLLENIIYFKKNKISYRKIISAVATILIIIILIEAVFFYIKEQKDQWEYPYIVDNGGACDNKRELIYTNFLHEYYLPCTKSNKIKLSYNKKVYTLKELLENNMIYIDELKKLGIDYEVIDKYHNIIITIGNREIVNYSGNDFYHIEEEYEFNYLENQGTIKLYIIPDKKGSSKLDVKIIDSNNGNEKKHLQYYIIIDAYQKVILQKV